MIDYTLPLDQLPDPLPIEPLRKPFDVRITPPGSKSITCRAYVLAALAKGESRIIRPLRADDTDLLLEALCTLGAEARWEGEDVYIKGVNGRFPRGGRVYLGDGGTPTRFMIACACLAAEPVVVDASPRMRERPIAEGVEMLRQLGAKIEYVEEQGRLPVRVVPCEKLQGGTLTIHQSQTSQSISAVLLIGSFLTAGLRVRFSRKIPSENYIWLTLDVLNEVGAIDKRHILANMITTANKTVEVKPETLEKFEFQVDPDASSALYFCVAGRLINGASVYVPGLSNTSRQPDCAAIYELDHLGGSGNIDGSESFRVPDSPPKNGFECNCSGFPDGSMALIAASSTLTSMSRFTGLRTLRVKETDRIAALANELRKVGCTVETGEDWISIDPPRYQNAPHAGSDRREDPDRRAGDDAIGADSSRPRSGSSFAGASSDPAFLQSSDPAFNQSKFEPVIIETYNDHRMAMAFAVLGLVRPGLSIRNPACVRKSYPGFWKDFAKLYG